jgi:hypothetical protein
VDLRFFHLDDLAACVRKIVQFFIERVAERHDARRQILVMGILHSESHELGSYSSELHRLGSHSLCCLEELGVLQFAPTDGTDNLRHDTSFKIIMQDVSTWKRDAARSGPRQLWTVAIKPGHVIRGITGPALTTDVLIEAAITVGNDIQSGQFLFFQINGKRIRVLLAKPRVYHRIEKGTISEVLGIPAGSGQ